MKITHIQVSNFKSLADFSLELSSFNCLIGLNGAGKSTVLQFFDFLSQQMKGDISGWLQQRNWDVKDLNCKILNKHNIDFAVTLTTGDGQQLVWNGSFNRTSRRCTTESVDLIEGQRQIALLKVRSEEYHIVVPYNGSGQLTESAPISFTYQGSILSQLKDNRLSALLLELKHAIAGIHSLELLSPALLRQKTRDHSGTIGLGGERLSSYLATLDEATIQNLEKLLKKAYGSFHHLEIKTLRAGWKELQVTEKFGNKLLQSEARQVNDGLLRMLAVFSQLSIDQSLLLLDEIENGINPELVEYLIDTLVTAKTQVLVTTHSPLILNYLDDQVAKTGVIYLYKGRNGATRAMRFFDIPSMQAKLSVMGPGEAYEDTNLYQLADEIAQLRDGV